MASVRNKDKNTKKHVFWKYEIIIFLLISLMAATIIRLYAVSLPVTDRWAESSNVADKDALSEQFKDLFKDKNDEVYLYGVDPYYYLGEAEDITDGKNILDGRQSQYFLPYLEIFSHKAFKIFDSKLTLIKTAFWLPFVSSLLSVILVFFIARKLTNNIGGFFASFLLAINPQFFTATQPGFADTNFLNLFFSLLIVLLFFEGIEFRNKIKSLICFSLMIPSVLLFKFTWSGYFYILIIISLFIVLYFIYTLIYKIINMRSKKHSIILFALVILLIASFFLLKDKDYIKSEINHVKVRTGFSDGKAYQSAVSLTTELFSAKQAVEMRNKGENPLTYIFNGYLYILLGLLSIIFIVNNNKRTDERTKYCFFITLWFIIMLFVGYRSIRFISFFAIPFSIILSYGLYYAFENILKYVRGIKIINSRNVSFLITMAIFILIITFPVVSSLSERAERTPLMNDLIESAGYQVMKSSAENATINLWWDKGYLYHYYSKRKVLMDNGVGGSFDPRMYWFSRAMLSSNESESLSILKMLDCGYWGGDPNVNISAEFCIPSEAFILLDNAVAGKLDIFLYFNNWYSNNNTPFEFPKIPTISSPSSCMLGNNNSVMKCGDNFKITIEDSKPKLDYKGLPFPVVIVGKEYLLESGERGPYSLLVYPADAAYNAVLIRSDLLESMFVRLYFMKGIGLEHFEPFIDVSNPVNGRIVAYKMKWD